MQKFLSKQSDTVALAAGSLLGLIIIIAYIMSVSSITTSLDRALNPNTNLGSEASFNVQGAASLDLKGLTPSR